MLVYESKFAFNVLEILVSIICQYQLFIVHLIKLLSILYELL